MANGKMPSKISPMLCTLVREPMESQEYIYELKWDGYRVLSTVEAGKMAMSSRGGFDYTSKYPLIAEALQSLGHDLMIDGEVVVLNEQGRPDSKRDHRKDKCKVEFQCV